MLKSLSLVIGLLCVQWVNSQTKILFDASKSEMAGSADWIIDADLHNIFTSAGPSQVGGGSESNPQRIPTPAQSGITATTAETYWDGGLSHWAVDCVRQGYTVETLPYNGLITYGVSSNPQDLSHYKVFVVDEPNLVFSTAEKSALLNFVAAGGGLLMIADHTISDRNNDGIDSPAIWNDLMSTNPFGIQFDLVDFSQTSTNVANLPTNPLLHGTYGNVTKAQWSNGTTMTLNTTANPTVKGVVFKTGSAATGNTGVMVAMSNYMSGKVVAIGDSSIADDGTGDSGDILYDGYIADASGNHQKLLMNAIIWLATSTLAQTEFTSTVLRLQVAPNPVQGRQIQIYGAVNSLKSIEFTLVDTLGRIVKTSTYSTEGPFQMQWDVNALNAGVYFLTATTGIDKQTVRVVLP